MMKILHASQRFATTHGHVNMLGHYSFTQAVLGTNGHLRLPKEASEEENIA